MKKLITLLLTLTLAAQAKAQYLETGITGGITSYIGDLQPGAPDNRSMGLSGGAFARWNISPHFAVKGSALYAQFVAADKYANGSLKTRNLESVTTIYELSAVGELNLTKFDILDGHISAPYLFAGISGLYFNPQVRGDNNKYIDLQPLGTEGQFLNGGKGYSRFTAAIPVGMGLKLALNKRVNVGFEFGIRYTFTDYLDDVSGNYPDLIALANANPLAARYSYRAQEFSNQRLENPVGKPRGDQFKHDLYYYTGLTLSVNLASSNKMEFNRTYRSFFKG